MKLSIIVPVLNCSAMLRRTLRSMESGGGGDVEVIIVDGNSKDGLLEVIREFEKNLVIQVVTDNGLGQYDAINQGMSLATGDILCWINGGDFFFPGAFEIVTNIFQNFPEVWWLTGRQAIALEGVPVRFGKRDVLISDGEIRSGVASGGIGGCLQQEGMFWRRELWEKCGGLDTTIRLAADFELWLRFSAEKDLVRFSLPLAVFSYHGDNRSILERETYQTEVKAVLRSRGLSFRAKRFFRLCATVCLRGVRVLPLVREIFCLLLSPFPPLKVVVISLDRRETEPTHLILEKRYRVAWIG